jgi:hypothetical protein
MKTEQVKRNAGITYADKYTSFIRIELKEKAVSGCLKNSKFSDLQASHWTTPSIITHFVASLKQWVHETLVCKAK